MVPSPPLAPPRPRLAVLALLLPMAAASAGCTIITDDAYQN